MAFNRELAYNLTLDDRDAAPFFTGRALEKQSFADAVRRARQKPQAVFRIFQGPPGCGKTSLAAHLEGKNLDDVLFVRPEAEDMSSRAALVSAIRHTALRRAGKHSVGVNATDLLAGAMRQTKVAEKAKQAFAGLVAKKFGIAIHIDEAHAAERVFDARLKELHKTGIEDRPCVVLLTGLGRTEERVLSIDGLSRASIESAIELGALSEDECEESCRLLLDKLDLDAAGSGKEKMARFLASLSSDWPQHLALAQKAFCEAIIDAEGVLDHADIGWIRQRAAALRAMYYEKRLNQPVFNRNKYIVREIVAEIRASDVLDIPQQLENLCARVIRRAGPRSETGMDGTDAPAIADALIGKGIVHERTGRWKLAIPSMGDWADNASPPKATWPR